MTRHQYGISALVSQTSFGGETSGSVAKCRLFSQAIITFTLNCRLDMDWKLHLKVIVCLKVFSFEVTEL